MSSSMPMEGLLRPPVEFFSALVMAVSAVFVVFFHQRMMLLPAIAYPLAALLVLGSIARYRQGRRIVRYQKGLQKLPFWDMRPDQVPLSRKQLFVGQGFRWTAVHTQRLYDAMKPRHAHFIRPGRMYQLARKLEIRFEGKVGASPLLKLFETAGWWLGFTLPSHLLGLPISMRFRRWGWYLSNPLAPLPEVGGGSAIHGVGLLEPEQSIYHALYERVGHTLVTGTTRVGKTRLCEILVNQDIRRGDCVIIIDPKGDADLLRSAYIAAKLAGREDDFYVFHLGYPEHSCRYNPIGDFARITEVATRVARQLPGEGQSATFREFVWGYVNGIAKAMIALGMRPDYRTIERYSNNLEPLVVAYLEHLIRDAAQKGLITLSAEFWEQLRVFANSKDPEDEKRWLMKVPQTQGDRDRYSVALAQFAQGQLNRHFNNSKDILKGTSGESLIALFDYDPKYYSKLVASLLPFLAKLTTGRVAEIIAPNYTDIDDKRPILEWMSFIRQNGIVYVGLDALSDPDVAAVVGSTMFSDLVSTLGRVYKHGYHEGTINEAPVKRDIRLHADEFSDLIREDFIPLLNKGGGAGSLDKGGFSATVYTQTISDITARLGDRAKAGQTLGNLNTVFMLRVKEFETAEYLTRQVGKVTIADAMDVSGTSDVADIASSTIFNASSEQRISNKDVPLIDVDTIVQLPKGQAFVLKDGGQLFKIRLPMPAPFVGSLPASIEGMANDMRSRYASGAADQWARWTPIWSKFDAGLPPLAMSGDGTAMPVTEPGDVDPSFSIDAGMGSF